MEVLIHLSPSSISMTGMSSTMGYLRPQSWQISQASLVQFQQAVLLAHTIRAAQDFEQFVTDHVWLQLQGVIVPCKSGRFCQLLEAGVDRQSAFLCHFSGSSVPGPILANRLPGLVVGLELILEIDLPIAHDGAGDGDVRAVGRLIDLLDLVRAKIGIFFEGRIRGRDHVLRPGGIP